MTRITLASKARRQRTAVLTAAVAVLALATVWETAAADTAADSVKAAFLSKFGLYVHWPSTTFPTPNSAVNLCIMGDDPFGQALDYAASEQRVNGREIVVHRVKLFDRDAGCHILYIGGANTASINSTLSATRGSNTLTVTDNLDAEQAGVINFVVKDKHVRFTINDEAAAQNKLVISSKLINLALAIKPRTSN